MSNFSSNHYINTMATPKPRGRPRTFDRQAALDVAMALFWQHGYEGTSIADLTTAMGVTPPTLYTAFGSKEQLYREVLTQYFAPVEGVAQAELGEVRAAYTLLEQYLHALAFRFTDPSTPAGCMVQTGALYGAAENDAARRAVAALRAAAHELLVEKFEWAKQVGELPLETDTHALARFYSAIVQGMSVQAIDGARAADLKQVVDMALSVWPGRSSH